MLSVSEAIGLLLNDCKRQDIIAPIDVPPADNSAMDGYAFRHAEWPGGEKAIPLSQRITAGSVPLALSPATAARIFTGAEVPEGADTVVMQEHCEASENSVQIKKLPVFGANIRPRGQDIGAGRKILSAGHRLRPQDMGLLASQGIGEVSVYRRLKVAILSTGDELAEPGSKPAGADIQLEPIHDARPTVGLGIRHCGHGGCTG